MTRPLVSNTRPSANAIIAVVAISGPGVVIAVAGRPVAAAAGAAVTAALARLALALTSEAPLACPGGRRRRHRGGRR
jgi:hypothetical protein